MLSHKGLVLHSLVLKSKPVSLERQAKAQLVETLTKCTVLSKKLLRVKTIIAKKIQLMLSILNKCGKLLRIIKVALYPCLDLTLQEVVG